MSEYTYELVNVYTYPKNKIGEIGGPGFDSGWIGTENEQIRIIISQDYTSPCVQQNMPPPS